MVQDHLKSNLTNNAVEDDNSIVSLHPEAYFKIIYHSLNYANQMKEKNHWVEVMGWLSGSVEVDKINHKEIIRVTKAWPISHGDAVSVHIEDYGRTLNNVLMKLSEKNETIIGWYHSHPSYGLFMSQTDFETQVSYQKLYEKAIALVFEPSLWSTIHLGLEAYRLTSNFESFTKIPIFFNPPYPMELNLSLYELFIRKIEKNYGIDELDTSYE